MATVDTDTASLYARRRTDELTTVESERLHDMEQVIERGLDTFIEVGTALATIRDGRLYRQTHSSFEAYVQQRYRGRLTRRRADQLIAAAEVGTMVLGTETPAPTSERQARELIGLSVEDVNRVMTLANVSGKVTSASIAAARTELFGTADGHASPIGDSSTAEGRLSPMGDIQLNEERMADDRERTAQISVAFEGLDVMILEALSNRVDVTLLIGALTMAGKSMESDFGETFAAPIRSLVIDSRIDMLMEQGTEITEALCPPDPTGTFKPYTEDELRELVHKVATSSFGTGGDQ